VTEGDQGGGVLTQLPADTATLSGGVGATALREMLPIAASVAPFAVVVGVATREADLSLAGGFLGSLAIYGGSAQLAAVSLLHAAAGLLAVVATGAVINARFLLYAAAMEPLFRHQPAWLRWVGPQFIVDQTYALTAGRPELATPSVFRRYWLAAAALLTAVWLSGVGTGMVMGPVLPASTPLHFAAIAVLVGLLVPHLRRPRSALAAAVSAVTAVAASDLPGGVGLLVGIGAGLVVAGALERSTS
jgi:predicted branched-subunit amino acid permease